MKYKLEDCIANRLRRLSRIVDGSFRKHFAGFDLTENQISILFTLYKSGTIPQGTLGERLVLERSTISRNIRLLEKRELVLRTEAYRPEIAITREGRKLAESLMPLWEQAMDEISEKIGKDGNRQLMELEKTLYK